jgi:large repetitive protein
MLAVARCLVLLAVGATVAPATALAEVPFAARYSANEPGAIWVTGSTLMTCPAAAANCAASQAGTATGAALSNNSFSMVQVDADSDPATFNSSSSTFTPPAAHDVLFAGLYFGGRVTGAGGGGPAPNEAARGTALLQTPTSGGYVPVSGTVANSTAIMNSYVTFADVTALVRAGGSGR